MPWLMSLAALYYPAISLDQPQFLLSCCRVGFCALTLAIGMLISVWPAFLQRTDKLFSRSASVWISVDRLNAVRWDATNHFGVSDISVHLWESGYLIRHFFRLIIYGQRRSMECRLACSSKWVEHLWQAHLHVSLLGWCCITPADRVYP